MVDILPISPASVDGARLYADRTQMMRALSVRPGSVVAEIGVAFGDFSKVIIESKKPAKFVAFDLFDLHKVPMLWGKPTADIFHGMTHEQYYRDQMARYRDIEIEIVRGDSSRSLDRYPDRSFDLIYVDGDHEYGGVKRDAEASERKITAAGIIVFNDYIMSDYGIRYGVVPVVNEMCSRGWRIVGFAFHQEMFCDIAISRS